MLQQMVDSESEPRLSRRALIGGALGGVGCFGAFAFGLTKLFSNVISEPTPGSLTYVRQIMILVDQTESLNRAQRLAIKDVLQKQVLPNIAPGDFVACYEVPADRRGYDEVTNRVFGDEPEHLPLVRPELVGEAAVPETLRAELANQWHQIKTYVDDWRKKIAKVEPPADRRYSGYSQAMEYLNTRFGNPIGVTERHLIVLGDLCDDPAPNPFKPPPCLDKEQSAYAHVNVALVRPFQLRGSRSRAEVDEYWTRYFAERGAPEHNVELWGLSDYPGLPKTAVPSV
jgi:hypothetical protein